MRQGFKKKNKGGGGAAKNGERAHRPGRRRAGAALLGLCSLQHSLQRCRLQRAYTRSCCRLFVAYKKDVFL